MIMNERIKELRQIHRLTLKEVAEKIGVSEGTVQRYESGGIKAIPYDQITALADLFDVDPEYIAGWSAGYRRTDMKHVEKSDPHDIALLKAYHNASDDIKACVCRILNIERS